MTAVCQSCGETLELRLTNGKRLSDHACTSCGGGLRRISARRYTKRKPEICVCCGRRAFAYTRPNFEWRAKEECDALISHPPGSVCCWRHIPLPADQVLEVSA